MSQAVPSHLDTLAIVGLACRFPGAPDQRVFWENLREGRESIVELDDRQLSAAGVTRAQWSEPGYIRRSPVLEDIEGFDARFFGVSAREAVLLDPQHRLLLEVGYEALEDAAHVKSAQAGVTGVFACMGGITTSYLHHFADRLDPQHHETASLVHQGNDKDFLATRLSFKLNLTGPSMTVQTACSSSLVALHLACNALRLGEIDTALVGASAIRIPHHIGYPIGQSPLLSRDGRCCPFSSDASGTLFGSGVASVIVRRHADALRDGDHVYALIRSSHVNNDGAMKIGYTATSVPGQAKAMVRAITLARADARQISYVECHGTATTLGDPLEIKALEKAFRLDTQDNGFCAIGSVKSNIGHLEQAAGIASLIKVALMLKHDTLVPSLNYTTANPRIDFERSPFRVSQDTRVWSQALGQPADAPRLAAINCLGIGGTNVFSVLQSAPPAPVHEVEGTVDVPICLSAATRDQLRQYLLRFAEFTRAGAPIDRRALAYTVNISRSAHRERFARVLKADMDVERFFADAAQGVMEAPGSFAPRLVLYLCDQPQHLDDANRQAWLASPRYHAMAADYAGCLNRLCGVRLDVDATGRCAELAFEVALYKQLARWGVLFEAVIDAGYGYWINRCLQLEREASQAVEASPAWLQGFLQDGRGAAQVEPPCWPDSNSAAVLVVSRQAWAVTVPPSGRCVHLADGVLTFAEIERFACAAVQMGVSFDWLEYYRVAQAQKLSLPTYPFARQRYWPDEA
ncbi:Malonyl CoA-acyl carrier protein transacylase [Pseudomonas orientalis]|uniref:beta-ketoacyl synthase N-terminal-like domain-containing protein n=1 Tax=Pseudomonas orientalis TaxID=76758 RepID=UPI000F6D627B|nr:polyketide synthase [Pseudomonas orientalis]AZE83404.1 Malonyl CoA-acyl carrier protein transacylase [Pseudomonas orientalis]